MKHIASKALGAAGFLAVIVALIAGKDDIRKFHCMRSM
jgi:NhaP-type Na+/H+ and K+/H+ antiporter